MKLADNIRHSHNMCSNPRHRPTGK